MAFSFENLLERHREHAVLEWRDRLGTEVSEHYRKRPPDELLMTTGRAYDSFFHVLAHNDYSVINAFINEITTVRLEAGFPLDNVQKAFELFRQIITPILIRESPPRLLIRNIEAVNTCLAYTIHRFSNHFQQMHETYLKEYAVQLEKDVAARTMELRESENKYKTLVEDISDGYLVLHKEKIILVNRAFCHMHGLEKCSLFMESFLDFVARESRDTVRSRITGKKTEGVLPEAFEYLRLTKKGDSLPTEINFRPALLKGQEYNLCILRDITKRVRMEKKSREIERMAYIGQITASLSHELRNPLSSVKMNLQILGQNNNFKGNDLKRLKISEEEIQRLEMILQQLLDFAKPVSVTRAPLDINPVVRFCRELLDVKLVKKKVDCHIHTDDTLPPVSADRRKIEQLLINLLLNAIDSLEHGGVIRISTHHYTHNNNRFVKIRVADNGKGIDRELLPHIFEPYYTSKTTGTGLGLANVKQIIDAHSGYISVMNLAPSGTAFEVFLPAGEPHG